MEAVVGILIIMIMIYSINKALLNSAKLRKKKATPNVELEEDFEPKPDHTSTYDKDRLDVAPEMVANRHRSRRKKNRKQQRFTAAHLKQGIIMKEILDQPRAKKPLRKR